MRQAELRRREELKKRQAAAGMIEDRFPQVASIVMKIVYYHRHAFADTDKVLMLRTMNLSPESPAYFHLQCLEKECPGEYDLTPEITAIVEKRKKHQSGDMVCTKKGPYLPQNHASIKYEIDVTYQRKRTRS